VARKEGQMEELLKRIATILEVLDKERYTGTFQVEKLKMKSISYNQRNVMLEESTNWETFYGGSHWGGKDTHCCFKTFVTIPEEFARKEVGVSLKTGVTDIWDTDNPQFIVYVDGVMMCAMDINHQEVILSDYAKAGRIYELGFYAYSNSDAPSILMNISVYIIHRDVEQLYYDIKVPYEVSSLQREDSLQRIHTVQILAETVNRIDLRKLGSENFYQSIDEAESFIQKNYYDKECGPQEVKVHSIGLRILM
jgi:alpha-mannosidase